MIYGATQPAGLAVSTILASLDFETYSEAGYTWDGLKWAATQKGKPGLKAVGAWTYAEHPTADILCAVYDLKDGLGRRLWHPDLAPPLDLFDHLASGQLIEATNSFFEFAMWTNVAPRRYAWPTLPLVQVRDVAAKAGAWTLPRKLEDMVDVLGTEIRKDKTGTNMMHKLSRPRTPTKKDARLRYTRADSPADFAVLDAYCDTDVAAEDGASEVLADLSPRETRVFLADQAINARGIACDRETVEACVRIIMQAEHRYHAEIREVTGGAVGTSDELDKLKAWLVTQGIRADSITKDTIEGLLDDATMGGATAAHRALEIRQAMGSLSVKKTRAMLYRMGLDDRIRGLYTYAGAARTWRWSGAGVQPQNLPNAGPKVQECVHCSTPRWTGLWFCPTCFRHEARPSEWGVEAAQACIPALRSGSLDLVESLWGDALTAIAGCLRSLFVAGPGMELICSDFSAIEAVVIAELAGEEWQREVFRTHGMIYETTASKITGIPFEEFAKYKAANGGRNHPQRKLGKVGSLASGFGGWVNAWKKFGADEFLGDDEIKDAILKWRKRSPAIVAFWAGLEEAFALAVENPGQCFRYRDIAYQMHGDVLYCQLPSGRAIPYHRPRVTNGYRYDRPHKFLTYWGVGDSTKWCRQDTYGGKLAENVTQATARDIFAAAIVRLEDAGYPVVLHTHDEPCSEVPLGHGSIEEYEAIMVQPAGAWCADWPIRADGGWRGQRYRKG